MTTQLLTMKELRAELPRVIEFARVDRDYHVIVDSGPHYVQFAFPAGWILGEAVSNEYLGAEDRIGEHDEAVLDILGWERPGGVDRDGHGHMNFHRAWHEDTPSIDIASDTLRTLTGAYGKGEDATFELNVFACTYCETHQPAEREFGDIGAADHDCDDIPEDPDEEF